MIEKFFIAQKSGQMPTRHKEKYDSVKDYTVKRISVQEDGNRNYWQDFMFPEILEEYIKSAHPGLEAPRRKR